MASNMGDNNLPVLMTNVNSTLASFVDSNLSDTSTSEVYTDLSKNEEKKTILDLKQTSNSLSTYLKSKMKGIKNPRTPTSWDPFHSSDWDDAGPPPYLASTRIRRDLSSLFEEPLPGIFVMPEENNFCMVHALILGPFDTPYEGGFFHFAVRFGPNYPIHPPRVRFMTTDCGKVRFNPNLYADGKVCLSILGTWSGPLWSPAQNLGSLLLSIQSILNEKPYFNEPGFTSERYFGQSESYNTTITHETIRVAVCGQLEDVLGARSDSGEEWSPLSTFGDLLGRRDRSKEKLPSELGSIIRDSFVDFYDCYVETCNKYKHLDGHEMPDLYPETRGQNRVYRFASLLERLQKLKKKIGSTPSSTEELKEDEGEQAPCEKESSVSSLSDDDDGGTHHGQQQPHPISEQDQASAIMTENDLMQTNEIPSDSLLFPEEFLLLDNDEEENEDHLAMNLSHPTGENL